MYQNELHPRRNFMFFCFGAHIEGALAAIILGNLEGWGSNDIGEIMIILVMPLLVLPICYLKFYRRLTGENDSAVFKHFKEIGIWLVFVFPIGYILYNILDSDMMDELADYSCPEDLYLVYIIVCTLSITFVTPFFKLGRMIARNLRGTSMNDMYEYYTENMSRPGAYNDR